MAFVGFKKATIAVLNDELKVVSTKKYVVEGKQGKGATSSFELSGLSSEAVKVYGSDVAYYVVQDGVGDPNMKLNLLDLPFDIENEILGTLKKSEGLFLYGEATKAPNVAIMLESKALNGERVAVGIFCGKFSKDSMSANTKEDKTPTPEPDEYTVAISAKTIDDKAQYVAKAIGDTAVTELEKLLFVDAAA